MREFVLPSGHTVRAQEIAGEGPPLVFVHGLGCASTTDYPQVVAAPALSSRRALLLDLLGFGRSDRPADADYSMAAHAAAVCAVIDALGAPQVALFGHSMGGAVAIEAAVRLGERLTHLVLTEPNLEPGGGLYSRAIAGIPRPRYVAVGHAHLTHQSRLGGNAAWAETLRAAAPHAVHDSAVSLVAGSAPSWCQQLVALRCPRVVVFGARSLPDADHARLPALGVPVDVVDDAGHDLAHDAPGGLADAIARALAREPRNPAITAAAH